MKIKIFTGLVLILLFSSCNLKSQENNKLTTEQWSQDIDVFINGIPEVHINPYHTTSKEEFKIFADNLKANLPSMSDNQILAELARMTAMIGDGHTSIDVAGFHQNESRRDPIITIHGFPLQLYLFGDNVYVVFADEENRDLIGKKISSINGYGISKVLKKVKPIVNHDNEYSKLFMLPFYLINAEYLNGLGLIQDDYITEFIFEDNIGKQTIRSIKPSVYMEVMSLFHNKPALANAPLYLQKDDKNYWYEYLENEKLLYINYNTVLIDPTDSLTSFCRRLEEFVNTHDIEKTVIDIRNNSGGNNGTCQPFVNFISGNDKVNQHGKLFTVIGRQTFSAASYLTTKLEFNTNTIFIGEPTGAKPNHYGDNRPMVLPNSGFNVRLSSILWNNSFPFDTREFTEPEIKVDISAEDYFADRDPVLETIINFKNDNTENFNTEFSAKVKALLIGNYLYEPLQYLEIKDVNDKLMLEIRKPDFMGRNVTYIYTPLYKTGTSEKNYFTEINGFTISQKDDGLKLSYMGNNWEIPKAGNNYKMPIDLYRQGRYDEAASMIKEVKAEFPKNVNVSEARINSLGYMLVREDKLDAALEIFKLNTELYPDAFNTFDSLGEIYLMTGNEELAIMNYKKSVELNDRNENGKKVLESLSKK